jgi:outer membrane protein insertion porin family
MNGRMKNMQKKALFIKSLLALYSLVALAPAKILDTLMIEGLFIQQPSVVENAIGLKKGNEFTSPDIQAAIKNLYRLGYFRSIDLFAAKETDSTVSLQCKVVEFPVVELIEFSGNKKIKPKDLEEKLTLKKGLVASDALLFDNVTVIKKQYAQKGYLLADIADTCIPSKVPGNVIVKFLIKENEKVMVKRIAFTGNVSVKESKLKSKFKTKEKKLLWGGDFDQDLYKSHLDSLIMYFNDLGFVDARIVRDSIRYGDNKKDIFIDIEVSEGKKYFVGDFFFSGNKIIETPLLSRSVTLKKGKPFQKSKFEATRDFISNAYREEGYLWVQVKDRQTFRGDTIDATFEIAESKPAIVGKINISGNTKTREKVIRREMTIYPGQKYKQSLMMRSVRDIYQLNFFSNVKPDLNPNDDGTVDLDFGIAEKENIGQFSLGAAYSQIEEFMGTMSLSIPNFRGEGEKLDLSTQIGKIRQQVSLSFSEPWAFNSPTTLQGGITYDNIKWTTGERTTEYGFNGGVGRRLRWPDDYFSVWANYSLLWKDDWEKTTTKFSNGIHLQPRGLLSKLRLTVKRDDTDMPTFPNEGSIVSLEPEIAGIGGDYRYMKMLASNDWYFPIFWKFILGAHAKFGAISAIPGTSNDIRISRWDVLAAGGVWYVDGQIRGYTDMSFGGRNNAYRGKSLLALSSELRFPILEQTLYLSAFADAGNTWASLQEMNISDLYPGVGIGVRLLIPMLGLMGFDYGYALKDPQNNDRFNSKPRPKPEFHFQMGKGF